MKTIELTEEHKSKLLEMCKELFPEYYFNIDETYFRINDDCQQCNTNTIIGTIKHKSEMDQISEIVIHWFEFCMTHLARKLLVMYDFTIYQTTGNFMYKHPIDFLYDKFKKLK